MARHSLSPQSQAFLSRRRGTPWVTYWLVALNVLVFALQPREGEARAAFFGRWGLVAEDVSSAFASASSGGSPSGLVVLVTLLTSTFVHAGTLHLLANLLYLAVFGAGVEGILGGGRFLALYLLTGVLGGVAHVVAQPASSIPAIGASGAIAGVTAAHLVLRPGATLGSVMPLLVFQSAASLPALLLLAVWLVSQVVVSLGNGAAAASVAWWAHVGGFASGLLLGPLLRPPRRRSL